MSTDTVSRFLEVARVAVTLLAAPQVAQRWAEPSVLEGYRVSGLAAHLGRGVTTAESCLRALGDHDPIGSDFHAEVRQRSEEAAADGPAVLASSLAVSLAALESRAIDPAARLAVLGGTPMTVGEYMKTRLVELAIHITDLCDSLGIQSPDLGEDVWSTVAETTCATAVLRNGAREVALGQARADRYPPRSAF
jgi:uncharacterized protein (TIGR03083 family)